MKGGDIMKLTQAEKERMAALNAKAELTEAEKAELEALEAKEGEE